MILEIHTDLVKQKTWHGQIDFDTETSSGTYCDLFCDFYRRCNENAE